MNSKIIRAAFLGGIILLVSAAILYGLVFKGFFDTPVDRVEPLSLYVILGELSFGFLIAFAFKRTGITTAAAGASFASMLGFLFFLSINLIMYGIYDLMALSTHLVDALVAAVRFGVAGAAVGWYLGRRD